MPASRSMLLYGRNVESFPQNVDKHIVPVCLVSLVGGPLVSKFDLDFQSCESGDELAIIRSGVI